MRSEQRCLVSVLSLKVLDRFGVVGGFATPLVVCSLRVVVLQPVLLVRWAFVPLVVVLSMWGLFG